MNYSRLQPWLVCFSASLFFFFEFIQLNMFNAIGPHLVMDLKIDARVLATISDKYFLANILFLFPAGILLDRISTRKAILFGLAVSIVCTYIFAVSDAVWQMKLARFVTGMAGSFCLLSSVRLASRWFPPRQMALVIGLIVTLAMTGGMLAQTPLLFLIKHFGWRGAVSIDAFFGLFLLALIFIFVKDRPASFNQNPKVEQHLAVFTTSDFWKSLILTARHPQNWLCGLYTSLMNLPIFLLGAIWGIFYLTQVRHLDSHSASLATLMLFVGVIIGSPVVGWLSDYWRRRKMPMVLGAVFSLVLVLLLILLPNVSIGVAILLFFGVGFATSTQIISYPLIAESNSLKLTATAEGLASTLIMAGGFTQDLFAYLMQLTWDHHYVDGAPVYSAHSYLVGMSIMPIAFVISLILTLFLRESNCKPYYGDNEQYNSLLSREQD